MQTPLLLSMPPLDCTDKLLPFPSCLVTVFNPQLKQSPPTQPKAISARRLPSTLSLLPQTQLAGLPLVLEQSTRVGFPYFSPFPRLHLRRSLRTSSPSPIFTQPLTPANNPQGTYVLNRAMKQSMPRHFLKSQRGNRN